MVVASALKLDVPREVPSAGSTFLGVNGHGFLSLAGRNGVSLIQVVLSPPCVDYPRRQMGLSDRKPGCAWQLLLVKKNTPNFLVWIGVLPQWLHTWHRDD